MQVFKTKKSIGKEFRRQLRLAVIAALGFTVAFAWRNAIYASSQSIITRFIEPTSIILTENLTATLITILAVILLILTSKILPK